jgi:hypothetical protein
VDLALNTTAVYLGPLSGPGVGPDGYRQGAYNFNFFAPVPDPVAGSVPGLTVPESGRFPGSGLHIPLPGAGDPTVQPWGFDKSAGGSRFTAHIDSANPFDDLFGLFIHGIHDWLFKTNHGC